MEHMSKAEELFMSGCNCSQAVFAAFDDIIGIDKELMIRISSSFGGGIAGTRSTCGAVLGMYMVMGAVYGGYDVKDNIAKSAFYKELQGLTEKFTEICGSSVCRELLGLVKGVNPPPSERTPEYYKTRPCVKLVSTAAHLLDEYIAAHPLGAR